MEKIIHAFLPDIAHFSLTPIGSGLIHQTWKLEVDSGEAYILQAVNTTVFKEPEAIAENLDRIGHWLAGHRPDYFFPAPLHTTAGPVFFYGEGGVFRMFSFVVGSRTYDTVSSAELAYEAARQFGLFTRNLQGFDAGTLRTTLPQFHDLGLRYAQFAQAVRTGDPGRLRQSKGLISFLDGQRGIADRYLALRDDPAFHLRVTHHDTKISNVLFDAAGRGLCIIDLDTVMPGYFISDVGDMIRTYVPPASEEEQNLSRVEVRPEMYRAIEEGYMGVMGDVLSTAERAHFFYAGLFMVYMQALRFLTDHLNRDVYYGAKYEGHNFARAANQAELLKRLIDFGRVNVLKK